MSRSSRSVSLDSFSKNNSEEMVGKNEERQSLTQQGMPKSSKFLVAFTFILFVMIVGLAIGVLIVGDIGRVFKNRQEAFNDQLGDWLNVRPALLVKPSDNINGYEKFGLPVVVDQWKQKADMPIGRSDHQVVSIGSNVYIIGGSASNGIGPTPTLDFVDIYDTNTDTWTQLQQKMNQPRYRFGVAISEFKIFVIGGRAGDFLEALDSVEVLDTTTGTWSILAPMPTPRSDLSAAIIGKKIFVMGGYPTNYSSILNTVEVYDIESNTWATAAPMNIPRGDINAVVIGESILVASGYFDGTQLSDSIEQYFVDRNVWIVRDKIPVPRADKGVAVLNGEYYTIAGEVSFSIGPFDTFSKAVPQVESYNPSTGVWSPRATYPIPAFRLGCASVANKIFCFGGHTCNVVTASGCVSFGNAEEVSEVVSTFEYSTDTFQFFRPLSEVVVLF